MGDGLKRGIPIQTRTWGTNITFWSWPPEKWKSELKSLFSLLSWFSALLRSLVECALGQDTIHHKWTREEFPQKVSFLLHPCLLNLPLRSRYYYPFFELSAVMVFLKLHSTAGNEQHLRDGSPRVQLLVEFISTSWWLELALKAVPSRSSGVSIICSRSAIVLPKLRIVRCCLFTTRSPVCYS